MCGALDGFERKPCRPARRVRVRGGVRNPPVLVSLPGTMVTPALWRAPITATVSAVRACICAAVVLPPMPRNLTSRTNGALAIPGLEGFHVDLSSNGLPFHPSLQWTPDHRVVILQKLNGLS